MRRWLRSWLADRLLSRHEREQAERTGFRDPWIRGWFVREWWEPCVREMLGRYPRGHPYHQDNPLIRYYPLAMTALFVAGLIWQYVAG